VEFKDLGVARLSVRPVRQHPQEEEEDTKEETKEEAERGFDPITVIIFVSAFSLLKLGICYFVVKSNKAKRESEENTKAAESEMTVSMEEGKAAEAVSVEEGKAVSVVARMQDGKSLDEKKLVDEEVDNASTVPPSSDKQSEPSLNGDVEDETKSNLSRASSILKALSSQDI